MEISYVIRAHPPRAGRLLEELPHTKYCTSSPAYPKDVCAAKVTTSLRSSRNELVDRRNLGYPGDDGCPAFLRLP
jgi:hypothetical protein